MAATYEQVLVVRDDGSLQIVENRFFVGENGLIARGDGITGFVDDVADEYFIKQCQKFDPEFINLSSDEVDNIFEMGWYSCQDGLHTVLRLTPKV